MRIVIDIEKIERTGRVQVFLYRPTVKVGEVEAVLGSCYSRDDAFRDTLQYLEQEYGRRECSKFALFHTEAK